MDRELTAGPTATGDDQTRWEGYSDYKRVSREIAITVEDAVRAFSWLDAAHSEGAPVTPTDAANVRAVILEAMLLLETEMEEDRAVEPLYDEILSRWQGEEGIFRKLDGVQLAEVRPGWLAVAVRDIRRAARELGYLEAGRSVKTVNEDADEDIEALFQ